MKKVITVNHRFLITFTRLDFHRLFSVSLLTLTVSHTTSSFLLCLYKFFKSIFDCGNISLSLSLNIYRELKWRPDLNSRGSIESSLMKVSLIVWRSESRAEFNQHSGRTVGDGHRLLTFPTSVLLVVSIDALNPILSLNNPALCSAVLLYWFRDIFTFSLHPPTLRWKLLYENRLPTRIESHKEKKQ